MQNYLINNALYLSLEKNSVWNKQINAKKYLDILWKHYNKK
jgi:hypothetical protein